MPARVAFSSAMSAAVYLSLVIGLLLGISALASIYVMIKYQMTQQHSSEMIRKKLSQQILMVSSDLSKVEEKSDNPFENPVEAIDVMIVYPSSLLFASCNSPTCMPHPYRYPLRRALISSLRSFIRQELVILPRPASAPKKRKRNKEQSNLSSCFKRKVEPQQYTQDSLTLAGGQQNELDEVQLQQTTPRSNEPSVSFASFRARYSKFCTQYDLNEVVQDKHIHQSLIAEHDVRIHSKAIERVVGGRWVTHKDGVSAPEQTINDSVRLDTSVRGKRPIYDINSYVQRTGVMKDLGPLLEGGVDDHELLSVFLDHCMVVTESMSDFVELRDKTVVSTGFEDSLAEFCEALGYKPPKITPVLLEEFGLKLQIQQCKMLQGCRWRDTSSAEAPAVDYKFYLLQLLAVLTHLVLLLFFPFFALTWVMRAQDMYAFTTATQDPLTLFQITTWELEGAPNRQVLPLFDGTSIAVAVLVSATTLMLLMHYASDSVPKKLGSLMCKLYALLLILEALVGLSYLGTILTWCILAAFIKPAAFLPQGTAVATTVGTVAFAYKKLKGLSANLEAKMKSKFDYIVQTGIKRARQVEAVRERLQRERMRKKSRLQSGNVQVLKQPVEQKEGVEEKEGSSSDRVAVGDIFAMLNSDEDGRLDEREFFSLFQKLGITLPRRMQEKMFAYADTSGDGKIQEEEFVEAWSWIETQIFKELAEEVGLSDWTLVVAMVFLLISMGLMFAFIFLALKAWTGAGGFEAVVQSTLIASFGPTLTKFRTESQEQAMQGTDLDSLIDSAIDGDGVVEDQLEGDSTQAEAEAVSQPE
jgi:hypothetical protein